MYKKNNNSLFLCFLILTTILVSCNQKEPELHRIMNKDEIKKLATDITVRIDWQYSGTGFIIDRKEQNGKYTYTVLTARHIVGIKPPKSIDVSAMRPEEVKNLGTVSNNKIDPGGYTVSIFDAKDKSKSYKIEKYEDQVFLDDKFDLAVVTFSSDEKYEFARLSKNIEKDTPSYLYGFKACMGNLPLEKVKEFNVGSITSIIKEKLANEGYSAEYTNLSILGMSGSPVFNSYGEVIAMHGARKSDNGKKLSEGRNAILKACDKIPPDFSPNLGIPMSTFQESALAGKISIRQFP
jgi:hypothetical protein